MNEEKLTDTNASEPSHSDIEKMKKLYLPESKADYHPNEASIESANGLSHPKQPKPSSLI
jgi:hypothetical protein